MNRKSYLGIDIIRLIAAVLVMLYHLTFWWWLPIRSAVPNYHISLIVLGHAFSGGWVGVDIFFVISGFVIAFSANARTPKSFMIGRALRLYPTAWICATITLPFIAQNNLASEYFRTMMLSPVGPWISGVYWTLSIEVVFYLLIGVVLRLWGAFVLVKLGILLGLYSSAFWWAHVIDPMIGSPMRPFFMSIEGLNGYLLLMHHGCYFALGIMLWHGATFGWRPRIISFALFFGLSGVLGIGGVTRGIAPFLTVGSDTPNYLVPPAIWCVAVLAIVVSIVWNDEIERILFSRRKIIRFLGLLTYPLYLVHEDMGRAVMVAMRGIGALGALAAGIACVVTVSVMVTLVEKRLHAYIGGRFVAQFPAAQLP